MLAVPGADFLLHNSLFLIAHFHNVIIGGVLFGYVAGMTYWFPKSFGFRLHEGLGKIAFWCWLVGFYVAFMPLYVLGFMGMTRRMQHYDNDAWQAWLIVAAVGARDHRRRHRRDGAAARLQRLEARRAARHHGRPVGRPHAGMADGLAAAVLQLRAHAGRAHARRAGLHEGARQRARARALRRDPHAAQHRRRPGHGPAEHRPGLRPDLAHLVAGRRQLRRA